MPKDRVRILHLEDSPIDAELIGAKLESENVSCEIVQVNDRAHFENAVISQTFDLILSDYSVPDYNGFAALKFAREKHPEIPFILVSGALGEEQAVDSLKNGATDYIVKQRLERLCPAVLRALREAGERRAHEERESQLRREKKASEARFRSLVEQALVGIYVIQGNRFVYVNPSLGKTLGYTAEEMTSRPLLDFIVPEERALVGENIRKRLEGDLAEMQYTLHIFRQDGSVAFVEVRGGIIDFNGQRAIMGTMLDITERTQAEHKIREQAALLDQAQDAICLNDMSQRILYWNKGAERLYGWTAAEAVGQNANDLLFQEDLSAPLEAVQQLNRCGEWAGELDQVTKGGNKIMVESRWTLMRDELGAPKSILIINTDVTEKKYAESRLLRTQRLESIGALAGGIAHDLNNSLAPILMAADMIRDELTDEESKKLLDTMRESAQRGADMVRQILTFSRGLTSGQSTLQLKHLIATMEKFAKSTFPRSIQVQAKIEGLLQPVMGDATQIYQVLMNLCINARDAMPKGGKLLIEARNVENARAFSRCQVDGPHVVLKVSDTGIGISPEMLGPIFEPFFTTKAVGQGTGLGLSAAMDIVRAHHGFIEVASQPQKGTTFQIFLPAVSEGVQIEQEKRRVLPHGSSQLILLVDDEISILQITRAMLEAHNYRILTAKDGIEAVDLFNERHSEIKCVITDMMMPTMSGPELINNLRRIDAGVKIIGISGLGVEGAVTDSGKQMVDMFLNKPFSTENLLVKLDQLLGTHEH